MRHVRPKTGTRNEFMRALGRKLDLTVTGFNAFRTDPQLRQIRSDLADRAERTTFGDGKNGKSSPAPILNCRWRCAASSRPSINFRNCKNRKSRRSKVRKRRSKRFAA